MLKQRSLIKGYVSRRAAGVNKLTPAKHNFIALNTKGIDIKKST